MQDRRPGTHHGRAPIVGVPGAAYSVRQEPDHRRIGRLVDDAVRMHCSGQEIVARGVSSTAHPGLSAEALAAVIADVGTDRYDPGRRGDRYENVQGRPIDLFGFRRRVTPRMRLFEHVSWGFYHGAREIHGVAVAVDVLTVYDAGALRVVPHHYAGRARGKRDGYVFRDPAHRADAVLVVLALQ